MNEPTGSVADQAHHAMETLRPSERRVARVLLADYPNAALGTVAELAEQAGVSGPTVLRFAQRLGFEGFNALQNRLREELSSRSGGPLARFDQVPAHGSAAELVQATVARLSDDSRRSLAEIPAHELQATVRLLTDTSQRVFVVGGRISQVAAEHLVQMLQTVRPTVGLLADPWRGDLGTLLDVRRGDVFVIFDIRRYQRESVELAAHLRAQGCTVIVLTDEWLSPAAQHAAVVLPVSVASLSPFDSLVSAITLIEALMAAVVSELGPVAHQRRQAWEQLAGTDVLEQPSSPLQDAGRESS